MENDTVNIQELLTEVNAGLWIIKAFCKILVFAVALFLALFFLTGCISKVAPPTPGTMPAITEATKAGNSCAVKTGQARGVLNVRSCAGTDCEVIAYAYEGQVLELTAAQPEQKTWYRVKAGAGTGYVNSKFCKGE